MRELKLSFSHVIKKHMGKNRGGKGQQLNRKQKTQHNFCF